ncbi:unnamed protein product [Paramecium primaurelia]|uniref:Uncharacterized protein n=1 Tax=Paramecium primaurelia TaxID=5886 RepID=A0A8S1PH16_PARPR|nr:unnamed protein product [Paramecium primaurelia]
MKNIFIQRLLDQEKKEDLKRQDQERLDEDVERKKKEQEKLIKDKEEIDSVSKDKDKSARDGKSIKIKIDYDRRTKEKDKRKNQQDKKTEKDDKSLENLRPEQLVENEIDDLDGINKKMEQYLKIFDYKTTFRTIKVVQQKNDDQIIIKWNHIYKSRNYEEIIEQWKKEVKAMLPLNTHFYLLPMRFNYTESEKIRSVIIENMEPFFMRRDNKIIFDLARKMFNYPNRIVCAQLILGYSYCQNLNVIKQKEESEDNEQEHQEGEIDIQKPMLDDLDADEDENADLLKKKNVENQQ